MSCSTGDTSLPDFYIVTLLVGVMTNPNCEYGANFIAIHTLAKWSKCRVDGTLPTASSDTVSCKIFLFCLYVLFEEMTENLL